MGCPLLAPNNQPPIWWALNRASGYGILACKRLQWPKDVPSLHVGTMQKLFLPIIVLSSLGSELADHVNIQMLNGHCAT